MIGANPDRPEHGVLSVKSCHLSVSGGANRGHLPLEKVLMQVSVPPVPPLRECHSRVAAARFARAGEGSAGEGNPEGPSAL